MRIYKIAKDQKALEKELRDLKKDFDKLKKKFEDLNLGNRKFWQNASPFNSLQRKVERFEKVEKDFRKMEKGIDERIEKKIKEEKNRVLKPLYEWQGMK